MTNDLFQLHPLDTLAQVGPFGEWLQAVARREDLVGVALRDRQKKLALSTRDDAWLLDLKTPAGELGLGVLRMQLLNQRLRFAARNLAVDLVGLVRFFAFRLSVSEREMYRLFAPAFVADLTAAAHCVNQVVTPAGKFRRADQDAFEIVLLEPQFAHGISPYYQKVGLPQGRLFSETSLFAGKQAPEWWVSYNHLWLRVLAYYSGDPTLGWAFHESRDPIEAIARLFKVSLFEAEITLLWVACGLETETFGHRFANRVRDLPADLPQLTAQIERLTPSLALTATQMKRAYWESRSVDTLFGRKLRPGRHLGEAVAFRIFGTTEELAMIAMVTFWQNRPNLDTLITALEGGPAEALVRVCGVGPGLAGAQLWTTQLSQLASLANPLGQLLLQPVVTQAPDPTQRLLSQLTAKSIR